MKALRASAATANAPDAATSTDAVLANTTSAALSPGSVAAASPFTRIVAPRSNPSAGSMPTRTGADAPRADPGDPMPVSCTSIHNRPSRPTDADDVTSPVASTTRPSQDAALSRAGIAVMTAMETAAAAARSTTISPALDAACSRSFSTIPSTTIAPHPLPSAHHPAAAGTNTQRSATVHTATAMGSIRRSRLTRARRRGSQGASLGCSPSSRMLPSEEPRIPRSNLADMDPNTVHNRRRRRSVQKHRATPWRLLHDLEECAAALGAS